MEIKPEIKAKWDKFVDAYLGEAKGNGSLAAKIAGYAAPRASRTAYELLNDNEYIKNKIATYQSIQKEQSTDAIGSIDEIFEASSAQALAKMAEVAKTDPSVAQKFMQLKMAHEKAKGEVLGEFEGSSTTEIIRGVTDLLQETQKLLERAMEAFRTEEV